MYLLPKNNGNKTSIFIIIFMFIMIYPTTAIMLTTTTTNNPVYGQQDKTSFNATDSSNIQSIPAKKVPVGGIEIAYKMLGKGDPIYFSMALLMVWINGTRPFQESFFKSHSNCV